MGLFFVPGRKMLIKYKIASPGVEKRTVDGYMNKNDKTMKKTLDEKYEQDLKAAGEAIDRGSAADGAFAGGERISDERVEELVESVRRANQIDRAAAERRLAMRLDVMRRSRRMVRRWTLVGCAAAAMALFFLAQPWLMPERRPAAPAAVPLRVPVALGDITVPTIISAGADDEILAFDSLELVDAGQAYDMRGDSALLREARKPVAYNRIVIPKGYTYRVELADGSRVTLNAGSELRYPVMFGDSLREVEFRGEGYFEVAKGATPFVVRAGDTRVRVYGTRFNFLHSESLALSEAVLVEGSIGMSFKGKEVKIRPNERVSCSLGDSLLRVDTVDPSEYTAWLGESFKYNGTRLDKIMHDIANWYGVEIAVSPELRSLPYTLEIDKSTTLADVMRMMELITSRTIKQEGGTYLIY